MMERGTEKGRVGGMEMDSRSEAQVSLEVINSTDLTTTQVIRDIV